MTEANVIESALADNDLLDEAEKKSLSDMFEGNDHRTISASEAVVRLRALRKISSFAMRHACEEMHIEEEKRLETTNPKTDDAWSSLTTSERIVAEATLSDPSKPDTQMAEETGLSVGSIPTLRGRARKKLGIALKKEPVMPEPKNKHFSPAEQFASPPPEFETLASVWQKLTPRQRCVTSLALQGVPQEEIAQRLNLTVTAVQGHKSQATTVTEPVLLPQPDEDIDDAKWNTLGPREKEVVRLRRAHPEWTSTQIADALNENEKATQKTESAVRQALAKAGQKLGTSLRRRNEKQYNSPPSETVSQAQWNKLQPRHMKVAWHSLADPHLGPKEIVELLGIKKKTSKAAIKYVKELRREAGLILGLKLRKQRKS